MELRTKFAFGFLVIVFAILLVGFVIICFIDPITLFAVGTVGFFILLIYCGMEVSDYYEMKAFEKRQEEWERSGHVR